MLEVGRSQGVLQTDQEPAITELFRAVAKARGEERTVCEMAPRSDSKANGRAERAVQAVEEMCRVLLIDLENRCGVKLSVRSAFFPWLLEHACDVINKYLVQSDGRTAYEQIPCRA